MTLILICLGLSLFFLAKGFMSLKKQPNQTLKMIKLVSDVSLLGLVIGFLGSILGLISAFDAIEGELQFAPDVLAAGLKVSFLTVLFGAFVFVISRIGILILRSLLRP